MLSSPKTNAERIALIPLIGWALAFGPMLAAFFRQQWFRPEYQAFPLMLGAAGYFLYSRWSEAPAVDRRWWPLDLVAWSAVGLAILLLGASYWVYSPWLAMAGFLCVTFAGAVALWQRWRIAGLAGIWFLLVLLVPPPLDRDQMFIEWLQLFSSKLTSLSLDFLGILHVMQGNTLKLLDRDLFVDDACSGIVSMISIIYCIAIYCLWQRRSLAHALGLIAVGIGWTILMNTLRLTIITVAWAWYRVDLIEGIPHAVLSVGLFGLSVAFLMAADRFLYELLGSVDYRFREQLGEDSPTGLLLMKLWDQFFASDRDGEADDDDDAPPQRETGPVAVPDRTPWWSRAAALTRAASPVGWISGLAFVGLGASYWSYFGVNQRDMQAAIDRAMDRGLALQADFEPVPGFAVTRSGFSKDRREIFRWDNWGQFSRTYSYQDPAGRQYQVSCDFLFGPHWHDLRACYRGTGWKMFKEIVIPVSALGDFTRSETVVESSLSAPPMVEQFEIRRPGEETAGLVTYGAFRANGQWFNRPRGDGIVRDTWAHIVQGRDRAEQADYFQIQTTTYFAGEITAEQRKMAEEMLRTAIERFQQQILDP